MLTVAEELPSSPPALVLYYCCNKLPQISGLKQHKFTILQFQRSEVQNRIHFLAFSSFQKLPTFFGCDSHPIIASLQQYKIKYLGRVVKELERRQIKFSVHLLLHIKELFLLSVHIAMQHSYAPEFKSPPFKKMAIYFSLNYKI